MPAVSIVMPVHNGAQYIECSVRSVLSQTFRDFEFIILDDASSDDTAQIINSIKDERIKYVRNDQNMGVARTLNRGLDLGQGLYIARMDADDECDSERVGKQVSFMDKRPHLGVSGTWVRFRGAHCGAIHRLPTGADCVRASLYLDNPIYHPTAIMRRSVLEENALRYDPDCSCTEDYDLWSRMAAHATLDNIPEALLKYRIHGANVTAVDGSVMEKQTLLLLKKALGSIGLECDEADLALHRQFGHGNRVPDIDAVIRVQGWMLRLADAVRADERLRAGMREAIGFAWHRFCGNNTQLGWSMLSVYRSSEFARYYHPSITERIKLISSIVLNGLRFGSM